MNDHLSEMSDKEILEQSFTNPRLFEVLINRYQEAFLRKSTSILKSKEAAEDAVQETFLKIYKYGTRFKEQEGASFSSWAYKILTNTCYTYYVRNKREAEETVIVDFTEFELADPTETEQDKSDHRPFIESVLAKMPESLSRVLRLYFLEEKNQKEIARQERLSNEAVRTRIHRAKKYFKDISNNTHDK